ncbi:MAG TPA: ATP-binding protein [Polyangiaceae bacterium]
MNPSGAARGLDELTMGEGVKLDDLVDRAALVEMLESVQDLFRVPLRVFTRDGRLLADAAPELSLYRYLAEHRATRVAVDKVVSTVKNLAPRSDEQLTHTCITGASYRVVALEYDGREVGRLILGPYLAEGLTEPAESLWLLGAELDRERVMTLFGEMPRASDEVVVKVSRHLARMLDLILFSEHRALLTSNMHLASIRESFRELEDKNKKLQVAYDRLKELDRMKSNFLATVSHELRTPLTSIIGYSEMLVEGLAGDLSVEQRDFVQTIREKGEQLLTLIKGLLDLSKLESGTMSLRKTNTEVAKVVREVVTTLEPQAKKKDVRLAIQVESTLPRIWADPERMRQILINLTENAVKFTPSGGSVTIKARLTSVDAQSRDDAAGAVILAAKRTAVEFRVEDTGIGIPEEERAKVFDAFYQVDSSSTREQGGTGLGLSIVKRLVEGHDGTVHIESNEPAGSVFVVTIPVRRATIG